MSSLDTLLEASREPEPTDDGFVRMVMADVKKEEQRRWRLKLVRRPVAFGIATAVLARSGAVAALVGTHVTPKSVEASKVRRSASVSVSVPSPSGPGALASPGAVPAPSAPASAAQTSPLVVAADGLSW